MLSPVRRHRVGGVGIGTTALLLGALAGAASPASAEGLGGITGWQPPTAVCGTANVVPVVITNYTNQSQTGSITIPPNLTEQVQVNPVDFSAQCPQRPADATGNYQQQTPAYQQNLTVNPGQSASFMLAMGGVDYNLAGVSNTFAIGGLPIGSTNPSWYNFTLGLNADESFSYLELSWSNTGGIQASNNQNGFNVVQCLPQSFSNGSGPIDITATTNILTQYYDSNNYVYKSNEPICLAWLPTGAWSNPAKVVNQGSASAVAPGDAANDDLLPIVSIISGSAPTASTVSTQLISSGPVADVQVVGTNGVAVSLPTAFSTPTSSISSGYWSQLQANGDNYVYVGGIPAWYNTPMLLKLNDGTTSVVNIPVGDQFTQTQHLPVNLEQVVIRDPATLTEGAAYSITELSVKGNASGKSLSAGPAAGSYHVTLNAVTKSEATVTVSGSLPAVSGAAPGDSYYLWSVLIYGVATFGYSTALVSASTGGPFSVTVNVPTSALFNSDGSPRTGTIYVEAEIGVGSNVNAAATNSSSATVAFALTAS